MRRIILFVICATLWTGCGSKQSVVRSKIYLETYSSEREEAIFAQMDLMQNTLLYEEKWNAATKAEFERLADTLLYVVEHCDDPAFRVSTRAFASEMEGLLSEKGALPAMSEASVVMAEVPYRWTVEVQKEDSLIMEIEIPLWTEDAEWITLEITYFKDRPLPPMMALYIPRGVTPDTHQFQLLFVGSPDDSTEMFVKHTIKWSKTYHTGDENYWFITFPMTTLLDNLEDSDAIIIQYKESDNGVMHNAKLFKERYSEFLNKYY